MEEDGFPHKIGSKLTFKLFQIAFSCAFELRIGCGKKCSNSISIFLVAPDLSRGREKIDKPGQTKQNEILTSQVEKEVA